MAALETLDCSDFESVQRSLGLPQRLVVFELVFVDAGGAGACWPGAGVSGADAGAKPLPVLLGRSIAEGHAALRQQLHARQPGKPRGDSGTPAGPLGHPLLASWGKQGRDYLHFFEALMPPESYRAHWSRVDVFVDPAAVARQPARDQTS